MKLHTTVVLAGSALLLSGCAATGSTTSAPPSTHHTRPTAPRTATVKIRHTDSPAPSPTPSTEPSNPTSLPPLPSVATCATSQLRLSEGGLNGAAGSTYVTYSLTNTGGRCRMAGFPGFAYLDRAGQVIGQPATRDQQTYSTVTLATGDKASFAVRTTDPSIPGTGCSQADRTSQAQVYPPNQTAALRVPSRVVPCRLSVAPVTAAAQ